MELMAMDCKLKNGKLKMVNIICILSQFKKRCEKQENNFCKPNLKYSKEIVTGVILF